MAASREEGARPTIDDEDNGQKSERGLSLWQKYKKLLQERKNEVSLFEKALSIGATFVPLGDGSDLATEAKYCFASLVTLINDVGYLQLARSAAAVVPRLRNDANGEIFPPAVEPLSESLRILLQFIRVGQLSAEMLAQRYAPERSSAIVLFIELVKAGIKVLLLILAKTHTVADYLPPRPEVDLDTDELALLFQRGAKQTSDDRRRPTLTDHVEADYANRQRRSPSWYQYLLGDLLYIARPIIFLLAQRVWGAASWKPWLISLAIDVWSRMAKGTLADADSTLRQVYAARTPNLLWYLLRAPLGTVACESVDKALTKINCPTIIYNAVLSFTKLYSTYHFYSSQS